MGRPVVCDVIEETQMREPFEKFVPTRRTILMIGAGAAGFGRLYAFSSDFWNKKEPSEWSSEEINQLTTKSPWAKEVTASTTVQGQPGGYGGGGGGGGIPGIGGMGGGRRRGGGMPTQGYKGTVRWESAKPILDALKTPIPEAFANHYVISVSGLPLNDFGRRQTQSQDPNQSTQDMLDHLKGFTFLQPKDKRDVQPGIVQQAPSGGYGTILFGFSKEVITLKPEDKEVAFTSEFGRLNIKAKFNLKDMMYKDELAV
jgi:hypothetical protein